MRSISLYKMGNQKDIELVLNKSKGITFFDIKKGDETIWTSSKMERFSKEEYEKVIDKFNETVLSDLCILSSRDRVGTRPPKPAGPPADGYKWTFEETSQTWIQVPQETETIDVMPTSRLSSRDSSANIDWSTASSSAIKDWIKQYMGIMDGTREHAVKDREHGKDAFARTSFNNLVNIILDPHEREDPKILKKILDAYKQLGYSIDSTLEKLVDDAIKESSQFATRKKLQDDLDNAVEREDYRYAQKIKDQLDRLQRESRLTRKRANWPSVERAVDIGLKPRFHVHPAGSAPTRQTGYFENNIDNILIEIAANHGAEYSQAIQDMWDVTRKGFSVDRALEYTFGRLGDLKKDVSDKKLLEIFYHYFIHRDI